MKQSSVISSDGLSLGYPKTRGRSASVLYENVSFDLFAGELTCLLGSNGAGKSTLLRTLTTLQAPLQGQVLLKGKDIREYTEHELSMLIGLVLTDKTVSGGLTVSELVALGRHPYTGFFGRLSKSDYAIIEKAMSDVCILHKKDSYVAELSDGERQKVMIAKALAQECPIIILDEPTAYLDIVNRIEITNLLHNLALTQNKTILLSTHDIELALTLSDRLWLLSREKGLKCGVTEDIVLSDSINDYLGNDHISFDKHTGVFVAQQKADKEIHLIAEGDLFYWGRNFLQRNNFKVSEDIDTEITVTMVASDDIEVEVDKNLSRVSSFEQLKQLLN